MAIQREFDGRRYQCDYRYHSKQIALSLARKYRSTGNWNARVIEEEGQYALYTRPTESGLRRVKS